MTKPILLYAHARGPNPYKVAIILDELAIPYEKIFIKTADLKHPPYTNINPNGRTPTIKDPNTGITLWESCAIIEYLLDIYDTEGKLHFLTSPEKYLASQYMYFQSSGQGPYFGQAVWFTHFHDEKLHSASERYVGEIKRVTKILDSVLEGEEYLVGGRLSYVDLAFVPWYWLVDFVDQAGGLEKELVDENPNFKRWMMRLSERPAVRKNKEARVNDEPEYRDARPDLVSGSS